MITSVHPSLAAMSTNVQVATAPDFSMSSPIICPHGGRGRLLPRAAVDMMEDYFYNESQWPEKPARVALAHRVNAVLQCSCYTAQYVYMHFMYLRRRAKIPASNPDRPRSRSPSPEPRSNPQDVGTGAVWGADRPESESESEFESGSVVAKLDVLLVDDPSPTPAVAAVWADVLAEGVMPEDILTYALLRQVKRHIAESQNSSHDDHVVTYTQVVAPAGLVPSVPSGVVSLEQAPSRQLIWCSPQTGSSLAHIKLKRRREDRPQKRAKQPPVVSRPSPGREDGEEQESLPSCPSAASVPPVEAHWQELELAAQIRRALAREEAPAGSHPTTFSDLCAWLHASGSAAAL